MSDRPDDLLVSSVRLLGGNEPFTYVRRTRLRGPWGYQGEIRSAAGDVLYAPLIHLTAWKEHPAPEQRSLDLAVLVQGTNAHSPASHGELADASDQTKTGSHRQVVARTIR